MKLGKYKPRKERSVIAFPISENNRNLAILSID